jgi:hypothetical protein
MSSKGGLVEQLVKHAYQQGYHHGWQQGVVENKERSLHPEAITNAQILDAHLQKKEVNEDIGRLILSLGRRAKRLSVSIDEYGTPIVVAVGYIPQWDCFGRYTKLVSVRSKGHFAHLVEMLKDVSARFYSEVESKNS